MKRRCMYDGWSLAFHGTLVCMTGFGSFAIRAAEVRAPSDAVVVERGANFRVWERTVTELTADGRTTERKSSYTELGTAMHYWNGNQWNESRARFRLLAGGAVADEGPMQVIVGPDASHEPLLDVLTPDSKRFQASPRWLAYFDRATGQSSLIATVKPCEGQLLEPNVIVFPDAFDQFHAALRLTYQPWGVEQEVVLLESGPLRPADWGLNGDPANIVLEVWSEFHRSPEVRTIGTSIEGGLEDVKLDFGGTQIGIGKSFSLGDEDNSIAVGKTWTRVIGENGPRQFLIEAVRQNDLAPLLAGLPQQARANNPGAGIRGLARRRPVVGRAGLLAQGIERLSTRAQRAQVAAIVPVRTGLGAGVSIDYSLVTTTSNLRLKGDTTYLVTNSVTLSGTTIIEGGAVLKFSNFTNTLAGRLLLTGPLVCETSPRFPAILTGTDDNTVGEAINGSTGVPGNSRYAGRALDLNAANTVYDLHDLHFRYPDKAIYISSSSATSVLSHIQIGYANVAIHNSYAKSAARNLLVHDTLTAIHSANGGTNRIEHATFHRVGTFRNAGTVFATNSLFICVTNGLVFTGSNVETNLSDTGVFATVGAGGRYLSKPSYRNSGTTNIDPTLLEAIRQRTTQPPRVLTGDIVSDTTLYPQTRRDTAIPDLGFHYDCLDYCWTGLTLSNATLRLAPGVAVAVYGTNGIRLENGAKFISQGTPTLRNSLVRYQAVQEEPIVWGAANETMSLFRVAWAPSQQPELRFRFTDISFLADPASQCHIAADLWAYVLTALEFKDSTLHGGYFDVRPLTANPLLLQTIGITNSLLQRGQYYFNAAYYGDYTPVLVHLRNNLVKDCTLNLKNMTNTTTWTVHDSLFDAVTLSGPSTPDGLLVNTHNGYLGTTVLAGAVNTQTVPYADFQAGPIGSHYYPTNGTNLFILVNAGSRNADAAGLWHFTVHTNQVAETNSVVDVGRHFAVLGSQSSAARDTDGDGFADVDEDTDGDGAADPGETSWLSYNSLFGIGVGPGLVVFTPLKP